MPRHCCGRWWAQASTRASEPGHVRDALRRRPRPGAGDAWCARAVRGRRHRRRADGYARMAGRPAAVLLHLGPGLGNGLANLHNARKGYVPVVNIVGDRDLPQAVRRPARVRHRDGGPQRVVVGADLAVDRAALGRCRRSGGRGVGPPGQVATLILPADVSMERRRRRRLPVPPTGRSAVDADTVEAVAKLLRSGEPVGLFLGGAALGESEPCWPPPGSAPRPAPSCSPRRSRPGSSGAAGCRRSSGWRTWPSSRRCSSPARHLVVVDSKAPVVLRLPRQGGLPRARRLGARAGRTGR